MRVTLMRWLVALMLVAFVGSSTALAKAPKKYQVTGEVLELTDDLIVVQKGDEKWELARDKDTKVKGKLAVGSKVTIEYTMWAGNVEVKEEKPK